MTLEQEIAFSKSLIDAGVPQDAADVITDCASADGVGPQTEDSLVASISCWHDEPETALLQAMCAADECP